MASTLKARIGVVTDQKARLWDAMNQAPFGDEPCASSMRGVNIVSDMRRLRRHRHSTRMRWAEWQARSRNLIDASETSRSYDDPHQLDPRRNRGPLRPAVHRARVPRGGGASGASRGGRGAAVHPAVDQDRRVPGGLRLLLAIGARQDRPQGREIDGRRGGAGRGGGGQGAWLAALLHGRGVARAQGPRHAAGLRDGRGREGDGAGNLHDARHADRRARRGR